VIALMAEGRRRVRERFGVELEPEVQFLGEVDASPLWGAT
jgi:UDP-N-acetylenolpyruvoylglucosamine reductase